MRMRVALVGVTHWHAAIHLDAIRYAAVTLLGVADRDATAAAEFAARNATRALPLPELLAERPDLVVLMGHPATVGEDFASVLAAGLPMMLEKPAAISTEPLADRARRHGCRFVAVPLANRCSPLWGELGRLRRIGRSARFARAFPRRERAAGALSRDGVPWLLDPAMGGGGALRNLGLHAVDAALALLGEGGPAFSARAVEHGPWRGGRGLRGRHPGRRRRDDHGRGRIHLCLHGGGGRFRMAGGRCGRDADRPRRCLFGGHAG